MYREQTAGLISAVSAHVRRLTKYVSLQIFIQIVNVLDLHFQDQRFESGTLASSYVIILQTVTNRTMSDKPCYYQHRKSQYY